MTDRLIALVPLAILAIFLGIMATAIGRLDLTAVILVTYALAAWDFLGPRRRG